MLRAERLIPNRYARVGVGSVIGLLVGLVLMLVLPGYYVYLGISVVVAAISLLGLGIVTGSAGMIALSQLSLAAIGAWVVSWLNVQNAPGGPIVWLALGGVAAGIIGTLVGLPALRLRGVNLAVVTIGFAAAVDLAVDQVQFPGATTYVQVIRPDAFSTDQGFFFFAVIVLVVCAAVVSLFQSSRIGSGWRSVAFSERGTASSGGSVRAVKLSAFAINAVLAGLSGGLVVQQVGIGTGETFAPIQSLAMYVLAVVSGTYLIDMALFGGILWVVIPEILKQLGISQNWGFVIFGLLGVQSLTTKSNLGEDARRFLRNRFGGKRQQVSGTLGAEDVSEEEGRPPAELVLGAPILHVEDVKVHFGNVKAVDGVSFTVHEGEIMGLIGPNGAGKSTMIDALSGFLPQHTGSIRLGDVAVDKYTPTRLARNGLRRTFQQDRVPPGLTVGAYVRFVAHRRITQAEVDELLEFLGCPPARVRLAQVDVGTRRVVEIAAHLAARPKLLLLDEPAAGLSHGEHLALAKRLREIPGRFGTAILIVEHDLDLVRSVCVNVTALDFGQVIASGPQDAVLNDPEVLKAYMGEAELT